MELILINQSKLKIMLDESDMKEYNIGGEADCASGEVRHAIRSILDMAKSRIGFDTEGSEIFVQLYTSKSGGCELFVTKGELVGDKSAGERANEKRTRKRDTGTKKAQGDNDCHSLAPRGETKPQGRRSDGGRMIFSFESLAALCAVCKILAKMGAGLESRAYSTSKDCWFLLLENTNMSAYTRLDRLTFILEYGKRERADYVSTYLSEHGRVICEHEAISILAQF